MHGIQMGDKCLHVRLYENDITNKCAPCSNEVTSVIVFTRVYTELTVESVRFLCMKM